MDTLLVDGDHYLGDLGLPVTLTGAQERVQQALLRLSLRRGSFPLDTGLGSELYKLSGARPDALQRLALGYVREALAPITDVEVEQVAVRREGRDNLRVTVQILYDGQRYPLAAGG